LEQWLRSLNYSDLAIAAGALSSQIAARRFTDCEEQVSRINGLIAEDPELYVLLSLRGAPDSTDSEYKLAKLKGMFVETVNDEVVPSLIIASDSGSEGLVPEEYSTSGLYVK